MDKRSKSSISLVVDVGSIKSTNNMDVRLPDKT